MYNIKNGDILLSYDSDRFPSRLINTLLKPYSQRPELDISHVAIVVEDKVLEALMSGVTYTKIDDFFKRNEQVIILRPQPIVSIPKFIKSVKKWKGKKYGWIQIFLNLCIWFINLPFRLFKKDIRKFLKKDFDPNVICSELAAIGLEEQGLYVIKTIKSHNILPTDLIKCPFYDVVEIKEKK